MSPEAKLPSSSSLLLRIVRWVLVLLLAALGLFAAYTWASLHFTYSEGERIGYIRKISKRGWLCKTWEGELSMSNTPGAQEAVFEFTVPEDSVADQVRALEGARVSLSYKERKGIPSTCFGDTPYHVVGVRRPSGSK